MFLEVFAFVVSDDAAMVCVVLVFSLFISFDFLIGEVCITLAR